jgi:hypothetical protein
MFSVTGHLLFGQLGEPRSIHLGTFPRKAAAIAFAREAVNRHGITHTAVIGRVTVVKEFIRYQLTDAERAELAALRGAA